MQMFIVSEDAIKDLMYSYNRVAVILSKKQITKQEDETLQYCSKLLDAFFEDINRNNPTFGLKNDGNT